jgi:hypothetical protein
MLRETAAFLLVRPLPFLIDCPLSAEEGSIVPPECLQQEYFLIIRRDIHINSRRIEWPVLLCTLICMNIYSAGVVGPAGRVTKLLLRWKMADVGEDLLLIHSHVP